MPISKTDLAMLKLSYTGEEFSLLEAALAHEPSLVAKGVAAAKPSGFNDTFAYDRIICSLFAYARNEYDNTDQLPYWAEEWFDAHWPSSPYRDFHECAVFNENSRYDRISLVSL